MSTTACLITHEMPMMKSISAWSVMLGRSAFMLRHWELAAEKLVVVVDT